MVKIENPALNGAELIRELKKTGTSASKLELATQLLGFIHRKEKRIARADELIDAMEQAGQTDKYLKWPRTPNLTLQKAYTLARTGKWSGPVEEVEPAVEDLILAGQKLPDEAVKSPLEEMVTAPMPSKADTLPETEADLVPAPKGRQKPGVIPTPAVVV